MTSPSAVILYLIIIIIVSAVEGWFIHRRIENEWDRWQIFIVFIMGADFVLAMMGINGWAMLGIIAGGLLLALNINRAVQNLIKQREGHQNTVSRLAREIESQIARRGN